MKRSFRPRKSANLSDSVQQQLNKYSLAAAAAGVGLVLGQPAEAKIVYTPADTISRLIARFLLTLTMTGSSTSASRMCTASRALTGSITRAFCRFFLRIRPTRLRGLRG
jgi:hypothetical protein